MSNASAIDTTTLHNKVYRTFQFFCGADYMSESEQSEVESRASVYKMPGGLDVFHWPEFQALAKRLMIDVEAPIRRIAITVPFDGLVTVTVESVGLDQTRKK